MRELLNIRRLEQAKVLLNPIRVQLLHMLREPRTCAELSQTTGLSQQRVNAHLKEMLKRDLIVIAKRRRVRNLVEATYRAAARAYWFSPAILRDPEVRAGKLQEQLSLNNLLIIAEMVQEEVSQLFEVENDEEIPSVGITAEVFLPSEGARRQFTRDVLGALTQVLEKYQTSADGAACYKAVFLTYPLSTKRS